jgi:hypothetical protein
MEQPVYIASDVKKQPQFIIAPTVKLTFISILVLKAYHLDQ